MLNLARTHDFQVQLSPSPAYPAVVNPPSFNWPENIPSQSYTLELQNLTNGEQWTWDNVNSPMQLSFELAVGQYQWRLVTAPDANDAQTSEWITFSITEEQPSYIAPTADALFAQCEGHDQWLMYLDEDIDTVKAQCADIYPKLKQTAALAVPMADIKYPNHYIRGQEEGKREAIANARKWIDRDLMANALLYRIWGEEEHGMEAMSRLLQLAEWSPEGPATLLQPYRWGDEVGCSLSRNLFLAYHWLSPLLTDIEKEVFVRPWLVRIGQQLRKRLEQDYFEQYPGHSHTSRLPGYLGLAALTLHREHDKAECEEWLTYALKIYRGILPFYGGSDGSWVEGPFYASTYSKWFHPFFLSVERLSGFSFYEHPFYENFLSFARDFIAPDQELHPFSDGFWCQREGKEWPGFFSQNPLRVYAARFGDKVDYAQSQALESVIDDYRLHLLDVIPTIKQLELNQAVQQKEPTEETLKEQKALSHYYGHAGLGKLTQEELALYYRASAFGNSSHRHGDQGNFALFENGIGVLIPTGSYGYRFGSKHHKDWTRQTVAHNLPLIDGQGQKLDDQSATAKVISRISEDGYHAVTLDLSEAYAEPVERFERTVLLINGYGVLLVDSLQLSEEKSLNWRLHSSLTAQTAPDGTAVTLASTDKAVAAYQCHLLSHSAVEVALTHGYEDELSIPDRAIESDASQDVVHLDWTLAAASTHQVTACCIKDGLALPKVTQVDGKTVIEITGLANGDALSINLA